MKLDEHYKQWARKNPTKSFKDYAALFGFTPQLMRHYVSKGVVPRGDKMNSISKVTRGRVSANDFYR